MSKKPKIKRKNKTRKIETFFNKKGDLVEGNIFGKISLGKIIFDKINKQIALF